MTTYRVVRLYPAAGLPARTLRRGLTFEEARAWCRDPETSSTTCTTLAGRRRTRRLGHWFDGYEEER